MENGLVVGHAGVGGREPLNQEEVYCTPLDEWSGRLSGGSVLASWPLKIQGLPDKGLSSMPPRDSISLTKMDSSVSTTPSRYRLSTGFMAAGKQSCLLPVEPVKRENSL